MRLLDSAKRSKLTWLAIIMALPILLTACGPAPLALDL